MGKGCWVVALTVMGLGLSADDGSAENWPHWRGTTGMGVSQREGLPIRWSEDEGIAWKVAMPGPSNATPIVWDERVYVLSQVGKSPVQTRGPGSPVPPATAPVSFLLQARNTADGGLVWERRFEARGHLQPTHTKHNLASPSPVTDGEHLFVWLATGQLFGLDMSGEVVWQRHLGEEYEPFDILWAHGSSPALYGDTLYLLCDHAPAAYLLAVDKTTGKTKWKVDRGAGRRAYSTPLLIRNSQGEELIINSDHRIDAYDPATGELLWYTGPPTRVPVPTPVYSDGVLYTSRGYRSGPYMAIDTGGRGDVSASRVRWKVDTGAPYVSSLLYYRGLLYMATENGVASSIDPADGSTVWRERVGGYFSASPLGADGKVYLLNENGETIVLKAGREFQVLARNDLGERTLASPAVAGRRLLIRSDQHLYALAAE